MIDINIILSDLRAYTHAARGGDAAAWAVLAAHWLSGGQTPANRALIRDVIEQAAGVDDAARAVLAGALRRRESRGAGASPGKDAELLWSAALLGCCPGGDLALAAFEAACRTRPGEGTLGRLAADHLDGGGDPVVVRRLLRVLPQLRPEIERLIRAAAHPGPDAAALLREVTHLRHIRGGFLGQAGAALFAVNAARRLSQRRGVMDLQTPWPPSQQMLDAALRPSGLGVWEVMRGDDPVLGVEVDHDVPFAPRWTVTLTVRPLLGQPDRAERLDALRTADRALFGWLREQLYRCDDGDEGHALARLLDPDVGGTNDPV